MARSNHYRYLEARPNSSVKQPFVKGRNFWAEVLYRQTVGLEPRTAKEVARDYEVPLGAVLEAIQFCEGNKKLLMKERKKEMVRWREFDKKFRPPRPPKPQSKS